MDFFVRVHQNSAGILTYFKGFWCKMMEKDQAAAALSLKAVFVRWSLKGTEAFYSYLFITFFAGLIAVG